MESVTSSLTSIKTPPDHRSREVFLCLYFRPVLECHPDIVLAVHRVEIHQSAEKYGIEFRDGAVQRSKLCEEVLNRSPASGLVRNLRFGDFQLCFGIIEPPREVVVLFLIFCLVEGDSVLYALF